MMNRRIKIRGFSTTLVFIFLLLIPAFIGQVNAADLQSRSISLSSSFAGEVIDHTFRFSTQGISTIGSIGFEYCTNTPLFDEPCTSPAGLLVDSSAIIAQSGLTGFSISASTTSNNLIITRAPSASPAGAAILRFGNITNPTTADEIVYVRISIFDGIDGSGTRVDEGSVVFVVEDRFDIDAYVPPYLTFCVGVTVALDCSSTSGFLADFGEFSTTTATAVTTQFSAATNDITGYNTFINGQTMTSGTNIIPALASQTASNPGNSQFGVNLRLNSSPVVGANPINGAVASGVPDSNYNTPDLFRFVNGDRIAGSAVTTGFNAYTVSYIVNISSAQAPGSYAATFIYTSIASF